MIKLGGDFTMMILASTSHENVTQLIKNLDKTEIHYLYDNQKEFVFLDKIDVTNEIRLI